jgi:hypothetical protein
MAQELGPGQFWIEIAKGLLPAEAGVAVDASQPVGQRWFHMSRNPGWAEYLQA